MLEYDSIAEIIDTANSRGITASRLVLEDQAAAMEKPESELLERMAETLDVMRRSAAGGSSPYIKSTSGITGGDGARMLGYASGGSALGGRFCAKAIATAIAIAEYNASMGKIVAAPTAGSCGILPAGILTMIDERGIGERQALFGMLTAGAIGMVIASVASISGAQGGCQAECGSAAAMTAGALVELSGGTNDMIAHAIAISLKNMLGLVCDPVAGLVEVPCIKRNAGGVMNAICAADMALAGIRSVIPADEVIGAMRDIGESLPASLRETAKGGLAETPTGIMIRKKVFGYREE